MKMPPTWRRVTTLARLDLASHLRSPLLWGLLAFAAFATLTVNPAAMIPSGDAAIGGVTPFGNSRYALAQVFALTGLLFYAFPTAILAGMSIPHDDEAKIGDLLHSTPLRAGEYLAGKFLGLLAALGTALLVHLGFALLWYEGWLGGSAVRGPFGLDHYLQPALCFLLPGVFFCAGIAFAVGELSRSAMAVYAVPTATFLVTLGGLIPRPASALDALLDPFFDIFDIWGARWLSATVFKADHGAEFYNTAPFSFDAAFFASRGAALLLPSLALLAAWRHCRRSVRGEDAGLAAKSSLPAAADHAVEAARAGAMAPPPAGAKTLAELQMSARPPGRLAATFFVARAELAQIRSQPGLYLFAAFALLLSWESAGSARGVFDSKVIHTAGGLAMRQVEVLTTLGCLLLLFHLVEALDRKRRLGISSLVYSSPLPTAAILQGTQAAGLLLLVAMLTGSTLVGLLALWLQKAGMIAVFPFVQVLFLLLAPTFLFWSSLIAFLYTLLRDRYTTYIVGLAFLLGTAALFLQGGMTWTSNWPLWGALRWSDFGAYELNFEPLLLNRLLFLLLALALEQASSALFPRVEQEKRPLPRRALFRLLAPGLLALPLAIYLTAQIGQGFEGKDAAARAKEYWRRNVATYADVEPPMLTMVDVHLSLEPSRREMRVQGRYFLANESQVPITKLPMTVGDTFDELRWLLGCIPASSENRSGLHLVELRHPLPPGDQVALDFSYRVILPRGYSRNGGGTSEFILPSGVVLSTLDRNFLPLPGFLAGVGVDAENRAAAREQGDELWRQELPPIVGNRLPFSSRMEIDLPDEFQVNAVGERISDQVEGGRRRVVFRSDYPVRFLNLVAGRWVERREGDTAIFHHPGHAFNVEEMLGTLVAARRLYSRVFYPYPFKELKISEYPDLVSRAQGFPSHIPFSEGIGFLTRGEAGAVSLPTLVTAHEAAHQWWGHLLTPGRGPGADVLIEGMAHYSTLLLLEAEHGEAARREFAQSLEASYAEKRRRDSEPPLLRLAGTGHAFEETVAYDKGAWVMWMLQEHLGRERMFAGLHEFIRRFEGSRDHPLLEDLIETLRPENDQSYEAFIEQWFRQVVLPEFTLENAELSPVAAGWKVVATARNLGSGTMKVEVAAQNGEEQVSTELELAAGAQQRFEMLANFKPESLIVDPGVKVLQLNRERARLELAVAKAPRAAGEDDADSR